MSTRMTIELGPDQSRWLEEKASSMGETKARVIRNAIALLQLVSVERMRGNTIAIVNGERVLKEIAGVA